MIKRIKGVREDRQGLLQDTFNINECQVKCECIATQGIKLAPHPIRHRSCQSMAAQKNICCFYFKVATDYLFTEINEHCVTSLSVKFALFCTQLDGQLVRVIQISSHVILVSKLAIKTCIKSQHLDLTSCEWWSQNHSSEVMAFGLIAEVIPFPSVPSGRLYCTDILTSGTTLKGSQVTTNILMGSRRNGKKQSSEACFLL